MRNVLYALSVVIVMALSGCAPSKPLTVQEQILQEDQAQCANQTALMVGDSGFGWSGSLQRSSYFEWCMEGKGYTKEQLKKLWY